MTKKRGGPLPPHLRRHLPFFLKALALLSLVVLPLAFLSLHPSPSPPPSLPLPFSGRPKVAFLFLARSSLPLDFLWHSFFQNGDPANFSVYVHSAPGLAFDDHTTRSPYFRGREIKDAVQVVWGEASMIEAERIMFRTAMEDPANQRFVLLSDSCVPLYNFSFTYSYLMSSPKSFVDSFSNTKDRRYNPKMSPVISKEYWRKGSQWITLVRKHAKVVVTDDTVFPVFKKHCKRRPDPDLEKMRNAAEVYCASLLSDLVGKIFSSSTHECVERRISYYTLLFIQKEHNCIPDEHYVQTLFSMVGLEDELERRTLTYTSWNQTNNQMEKQGWHPLTFEYASAGPQQIDEIKNINHVYYETEYRTEWCQSNGTSVPCFLFARKFSKGAALRLLQDGLFGPFDSMELLSSSGSSRTIRSLQS